MFNIQNIRTQAHNSAAVFTVVLLLLVAPVVKAASTEDLAKDLANPLAALISVPLQLNYDENIGPGDKGRRTVLNVQPVIPISLNDDWNIISRTILPITWQDDVAGRSSQSGLGDTVQSVFFSPKELTESGWVWGAGPVFLLPTATDDRLGAEKWGLGPTVVALKQNGPWTTGFLGNHISSIGGNDDRANISATYLEPFMSYTTPSAVTIGANLGSTYDWKTEDWSVPANLTVSKVMKFGDQLVSVSGGMRYWLNSTDTGPEGWGARLQLTFLFPK